MTAAQGEGRMVSNEITFELVAIIKSIYSHFIPNNNK